MMQSTDVQVRAYADDVNLVVENPDNVNSIKNKLNKFCSTTGARLNTVKCKGLIIGRHNSRSEFYNPINVWYKIETDMKILGVHFSNNLHLMNKFNWQKLLTQVQFNIK